MTKIYLFTSLAAVCAAMIMCCHCFTKEELFGFEYCNKTFKNCRGRTHVLCLYHDFKVSPTCLRDMDMNVHEDKFLTPDDQVKIVRLHNNLRALVTKGMVPNQPPALNMKIMRWDAELAMMAKLRLVKCTEGIRSNPCYTSRHNESAGTLMEKTLVYGNKFISDYAILIEQWFDEYKSLPPGVVYKYAHILSEGGVQPMYTGYTQLVWANTEKVGCERITSTYNINETVFNATMVRKYKNATFEKLYCLYNPRGNIIDEPLYEAGPELEWEVDTEEDDVPASARDIVPGPHFLQVVAISLVRLISA